MENHLKISKKPQIQLPEDIIFEILLFFSWKEVPSLQSINSLWFKECTSNRYWRPTFLKIFSFDISDSIYEAFKQHYLYPNKIYAENGEMTKKNCYVAKNFNYSTFLKQDILKLNSKFYFIHANYLYYSSGSWKFEKRSLETKKTEKLCENPAFYIEYSIINSIFTLKSKSSILLLNEKDMSKHHEMHCNSLSFIGSNKYFIIRNSIMICFKVNKGDNSLFGFDIKSLKVIWELKFKNLTISQMDLILSIYNNRLAVRYSEYEKDSIFIFEFKSFYLEPKIIDVIEIKEDVFIKDLLIYDDFIYYYVFYNSKKTYSICCYDINFKKVSFYSSNNELSYFFDFYKKEVIIKEIDSEGKYQNLLFLTKDFKLIFKNERFLEEHFPNASIKISSFFSLDLYTSRDYIYILECFNSQDTIIHINEYLRDQNNNLILNNTKALIKSNAESIKNGVKSIIYGDYLMIILDNDCFIIKVN